MWKPFIGFFLYSLKPSFQNKLKTLKKCFLGAICIIITSTSPNVLHTMVCYPQLKDSALSYGKKHVCCYYIHVNTCSACDFLKYSLVLLRHSLQNVQKVMNSAQHILHHTIVYHRSQGSNDTIQYSIVMTSPRNYGKNLKVYHFQ